MSDVLTRLQAALSDRYRLDRELGAGGMATVYLAHDLRHERDVAIKVLHPELGAVLGADRFLTEIRTTARLQHPHILPLLDSGAADGLLYYVMPFVEGETLRSRLDRERQLPIPDALQLSREVADALQCAHDRGVIHRDIKPENILLQGGHALVADFGIALAVQQSSGARMTQTGLSLGTPQYMAPEQAMGERTIDSRVDVYALGAVTYEMLTGEPPFSGPTSQAIVARLLTVPPAPPSQIRATVPVHIEGAVLMALQKLPADRFASVSAFAEALRQEGTIPGSVTLASRTSSTSTRRGVSPLLFTAACAAAVAGGVWGWQRSAVSAGASALAARFTVALPDSMHLSPLGAQQTVAISPDGREFVFPAEADRLWLYRRRLDSLAIERVPVRIGFGNPVYSPDGRWLAVQDFAGQLVRVPLFGGDPVLVDSGGARPSWGDHDRLLYLHGGSLMLTDGQGAAPQKIELKGLPKNTTLAFPFLLPGSETALVNLQRPSDVSPDSYEVAAVSLKDGTVKSLGVRGAQPKFVAPDVLLFTRQNQSLIAVPFDAGDLTVKGAPVAVLESVLVRTGGAAMYGVSDNGVLVYLTSGGLSDPVIVQRGKPTMFRLDPALGVPNERYGRISPDGRRVLLVTERGILSDILLGNTDTGDLQPLASRQPRLQTNPVWSGDGQSVLWIRSTNAQDEIVRRRVDGIGAEEVLYRLPRSSGVRDLEAIAGSDELAIAADATGSAGELRFVKADSSVPARAVVRDISISRMRASHDGRWLAVAAVDGGTSALKVLDVRRPERSVLIATGTSAINANRFAWLGDSHTLVYRYNDRLVTATLADADRLEVSRRDTLGSSAIGGPAPGPLRRSDAQLMDVSRSGEAILGFIPRGGDGATSLVVETEWTASMRRRLLRPAGRGR